MTTISRPKARWLAHERLNAEYTNTLSSYG